MRHKVVSLFIAISPLLVAMPPVHASDQALDKKALSEQFRDFDEMLKRLDHVSGQLHHEVNRYETVDLGADVLDDQIMDPWASYQPGLYPGAFSSGFRNLAKGPVLPPRERYVDLDMGQLEKLVKMFDGELPGIAQAAQPVVSKDDAFHAQLLVANDSQSRLDALNQKLGNLTKAAPYDNKAIATATEGIHDELKTLGEIRRRLVKLLEHDEHGK